MRLFLSGVAWVINWYIDHCNTRLVLESKLYRVNEIILIELAEDELWQTS